MMRNRTKALLVAGLLATTLALGTAGGALAQTGPVAPDAPYSYCWWGTTGNAPTSGWQGSSHEAIAQALGISSSELYAAQVSGKTVAQLASEKGVDLETVVAAALGTHKQGLDAQVQAGRLTQAQADWMQAQMQANIRTHFSGQYGPGSMMGPGQMMGPGSMFGPGRTWGPGHMGGPGHMWGPGYGPQR
jgi:hypothetical protein